MHADRVGHFVHPRIVRQIVVPTTLLRSKPALSAHNTDHILISNNMTQPHPLRHMSRARPPNQRILETLLECPMNRITHILDRAILSHDKCFAEVRLDTFALGVDPHESEFLPALVHDVADAEVELAGHDGGVGFVGEGVEVFEGDGVDFVVDVEAFDVGSVLLHDYIDELVDGGCTLRISGYLQWRGTL